MASLSKALLIMQLYSEKFVLLSKEFLNNVKMEFFNFSSPLNLAH